MMQANGERRKRSLASQCEHGEKPNVNWVHWFKLPFSDRRCSVFGQAQ